MSNLKAKPIGRSVHSYEMYPSSQISRSRFNRSNSLITAMDAGYLVPIYFDEALPGDTLQLSCRSFARLATQIVPFMDNVYMDVHFWCVPNRLLWSHWVNMNGEQPNPGDSTDYLTPTITTPEGGASVGSVYDYFGIPTGIANLTFNAFNFRAYNLVFNEWYRDENIINRVPQINGDTDSYSNYTLLKRGKRKDYFTSALPWPQKGPGVELPIGTSAPIVSDTNWSYLITRASATQPTPDQAMDLVPFGYYGATSGNNWDDSAPLFGQAQSRTGDSRNPISRYSNVHGGDNTDDMRALTWGSNNAGGVGLGLNVGALSADLSNATAVTINSLRQAFALQRMFEKDARGGSRYIEMILSHFGIKSPDERLQRPEFLGGATFNLNLSAVPQTSSTDSASPQGNLSSFGIISGESREIVHSFTEHCTVIGIASIRADYTYQQGLNRSYSRRSRTDYYLPVLANLGEQAILNKEIYAQGDSVVDVDGNIIDDGIFGYQERWAEYRTKQNSITGQLRSTATNSLDIWHLAQDFSSLPTLNSDFIEEDPPIDRVVAVTGDGTPQFICNFYFKEYWTRPMPVYSIPSMSSHF